MRALTKRQQEVLMFFREYRRKYRISPTCRDIADHFGWSSANAAFCHLKAIENKGGLVPVDPESRRKGYLTPRGRPREFDWR